MDSMTQLSSNLHQGQQETSLAINTRPPINQVGPYDKLTLQNHIASLGHKDQVQSFNSSQSAHSDDMDIDEQNDIVNELSCVPGIQKTDDQDSIFTNFTPNDRILYANTKKHQGNQNFKDNNLESAIQAYKFGLSLLKPQSFTNASAKDCQLMAELTSNILCNMGTCYFILMSFRYAIRFYDQAILIKPNYSKAIHYRALCHLEEGNLLSAYNDIKLAFKYDKQNTSILNDFKQISDEYHGVYGYKSHQKPASLLELTDSMPMSKSMIEGSFKEFDVENSDDTADSIVKKEELVQNDVEIAKLSEDRLSTMSKRSSEDLSKATKQKVKSFYGKRFYRGQVPKTPKSIKNLNSSMNSPKFRQYVFKKFCYSGLGSPQQILNKKSEKSEKASEQKSVGQFYKTDNIIPLLPQKIVSLSGEPHQSQIKRRKQSEQRRTKDSNGQYWGYIPIFVATGYGIYHSIKAVWGK